VNTLGSGDAFLAGVISAEVSTNDEAQILASGVAAGTASVVSTVPGGMSYANWTIFKKRVEIERNVS
jgi:fructose-1-phosphate kinase PfkB-like protein